MANRSKKRSKQQKSKKPSKTDTITKLKNKIQKAREMIQSKGVEEPTDLKKYSSEQIAKGLHDMNKMVTVVYIIVISSKLNEEDATNALLKLKTPNGRNFIGGGSRAFKKEKARNLYKQFKSIDWQNLIKNKIVKSYKFNKIPQTGGFLNKLEDCYGWLKDGLDGSQTILDTLGMIPPFGFLFDLMSVSINTLRGKQADAMFSLISMVPIAGDIVGKGLKFLRDKPELAQSLITSWQMQNLNDMREKQMLENAPPPPPLPQ